LAVGFPLKLDA